MKKTFFLFALMVLGSWTGLSAQCQSEKTGTITVTNQDFSGQVHYRECNKNVSIWFSDLERVAYSGYNPGPILLLTMPSAAAPSLKGNRAWVSWIDGTGPNPAGSSRAVKMSINQAGQVVLYAAPVIGEKLSGSISFSKE